MAMPHGPHDARDRPRPDGGSELSDPGVEPAIERRRPSGRWIPSKALLLFLVTLQAQLLTGCGGSEEAGAAAIAQQSSAAEAEKEFASLLQSRRYADATRLAAMNRDLLGNEQADSMRRTVMAMARSDLQRAGASIDEALASGEFVAAAEAWGALERDVAGLPPLSADVRALRERIEVVVGREVEKLGEADRQDEAARLASESQAAMRAPPVPKPDDVPPGPTYARGDNRGSGSAAQAEAEYVALMNARRFAEAGEFLKRNRASLGRDRAENLELDYTSTLESVLRNSRASIESAVRAEHFGEAVVTYQQLALDLEGVPGKSGPLRAVQEELEQAIEAEIAKLMSGGQQAKAVQLAVESEPVLGERGVARARRTAMTSLREMLDSIRSTIAGDPDSAALARAGDEFLALERGAGGLEEISGEVRALREELVAVIQTKLIGQLKRRELDAAVQLTESTRPFLGQQGYPALMVRTSNELFEAGRELAREATERGELDEVKTTVANVMRLSGDVFDLWRQQRAYISFVGNLIRQDFQHLLEAGRYADAREWIANLETTGAAQGPVEELDRQLDESLGKARDTVWTQFHAALAFERYEQARSVVSDFRREVGDREALAADLLGLEEAAAAAESALSTPGPFEPAWRVPVDYLGDGLAVTDALVIGTADLPGKLRLIAFDRQSGEAAWEQEIVSDARVATLLAGEGKLYVQAGPSVFGRDAASGDGLWQWTLPGGPEGQGQIWRLMADRSSVYAVTVGAPAGGDGADLNVYAVDAATGSLRWTRRLSGRSPEAAGIGPGGLVLVTWEGQDRQGSAEDSTYRLERIDQSSGASSILFEKRVVERVEKWRFGNPLVLDGVLYIGTIQVPPGGGDYPLVVMAIEMGGAGLVWEREVARVPRAKWGILSDAVLDQGRLHLSYSWEGAEYANLVSFDLAGAAADRAPRYARKRLPEAKDWLMGKLTDGTVFGTSLDPRAKHTAAYDVRTGLPRWRYVPAVEHLAISGPALFGTSGREIVAWVPDAHPPEIGKAPLADGSMVNAVSPEFILTVTENGDCRARRSMRFRDGVVWNNIKVHSIRTTIDGAEVPHRFDVAASRLFFRHEGEPFENGSSHSYGVVVEDKAGNASRFGASFSVDTEPPRLVRADWPKPDHYATTRPRIDVQLEDPLSGVDPASIRISVAGRAATGGHRQYDPATGRYYRERGTGEGVSEGEVDVVLIVRDNAGNEARHSWKTQVSLDYDGLLRTLQVLALPDDPDTDAPSYDIAGALALTDEVQVSDRNLDMIRRLGLGADILSEGLSAHDRLAARFAETAYFVHKEIRFTLDQADMVVLRLEGEERDKVEEEERTMLETLADAGRTLIAAGELVRGSEASPWLQAEEDLLRYLMRAPAEGRTEWEQVYTARLRAAYIEVTKEAWRDLLNQAQRSGPWIPLQRARDLARAFVDRTNTRVTQALDEWEPLMREAREKEREADYVSLVLDLTGDLGPGPSQSRLVSWFIDAMTGRFVGVFLDVRFVYPLNQSVNALRRAIDPQVGEVNEALRIPFGR